MKKIFLILYARKLLSSFADSCCNLTVTVLHKFMKTSGKTAVLLLGALFLTACNNQQQVSDEYFNVTMLVSVETLLGNMDMLDRHKHELVPYDGMIFPLTTVKAFEGETVFDVLSREMINGRIHLVSRQTPGLNSVYIEGIHNIFEFDAGPLSGWKYRVNGEFISQGASAVILQPDDFIEWLYTIDLGRDLGYEE